MFEPFTSVTKFACPRSRRTTTDWRALRWPPDDPPLPDRGDGGVQSEAAAPRPGIGEDLPEKTGQSICPATGMTGLERTNALSLWSLLVWQQIRPPVRSRRRKEPDAGDSPPNRHPSAAEAHSSRTGSAGLLSDEEAVLPTVETLLAQLARRRLPRDVTQETR